MPDVYRFLPGIQHVVDLETATDVLEQYDMAISVDCGSLDRLGPAQDLFKGAKQSVNMDHHISNKNFGGINVVVPTAAASGQVIANVLAEAGWPLDADIATCLYTAIVTDTGGFKYSNTTAEVFEVTAKLLSAGADPEYIYKELYELRPKCQTLLHAQAVVNAQYNPDSTLAWTQISRQQLDDLGATDDHVDGIVETLRQINTVVLSAVFKENRSGTTKVSLRSDNHAIDVAAVMEQFDGGGHKMAAGCTIEAPLQEATDKVLPLLEAQIREKTKSFAQKP